MIMERSGKDLDNMIGPFVVAIGLAVALCLNFGFKYSTVIAERESLIREGPGAFDASIWGGVLSA